MSRPSPARQGRKTFRYGEIATALIEGFSRAFFAPTDDNMFFPRLGNSFVRVLHWEFKDEGGDYLPVLDPRKQVPDDPNADVAKDWVKRYYSGTATTIFFVPLGNGNTGGEKRIVEVKLLAYFREWKGARNTRFMAGKYSYIEANGSECTREFMYFLDRGEIKFDLW